MKLDDWGPPLSKRSGSWGLLLLHVDRSATFSSLILWEAGQIEYNCRAGFLQVLCLFDALKDT